jgi:hypothetical protein
VALQIHAESLAELPGEERLALDGVRIDYTPADEAPWSISASHATTPMDRSHFDLEGDVDMRSAPTDGSKPAESDGGDAIPAARVGGHDRRRSC